MRREKLVMAQSKEEFEERLQKLEDREKKLKEREENDSQKGTRRAETASRARAGSMVGIYRYSTVKRVTDNFHSGKIIGKGAFGAVYKARLGFIDVAIKRLEIDNNTQGESEFLQEIALLGALRHENIVPLIGASIERIERCLIYPLMQGGSLDDRLHKRGQSIGWDKRLKIATQIAEAMAFLHQAEEGERLAIHHRDIRSSNVLLDEADNARLSDVGLAKYESVGKTTKKEVVYTHGYADPEYLSTNKYQSGSDVYSFGVVLFELLTGLPAVIVKSGEQPTLLS